MTVVVNTHSEQEEKALIEFLENRNYDFYADHILLSNVQADEILKRDRDLSTGNTTSRPWEEIKKELNSVYP